MRERTAHFIILSPLTQSIPSHIPPGEHHIQNATHHIHEGLNSAGHAIKAEAVEVYDHVAAAGHSIHKHAKEDIDAFKSGVHEGMQTTTLSPAK